MYEIVMLFSHIGVSKPRPTEYLPPSASYLSKPLDNPPKILYNEDNHN